MDNSKKYLDTFVEVLGVSEGEAASLVYQGTPAWDSVGHMTLVAAIEEAFDIMMDTDDIIDFSSFEKGKEILTKNYQIEF